MGYQCAEDGSGSRVIPMVDTFYYCFDGRTVTTQKKNIVSAQIEPYAGFIFCNRFYEVYTPESINRSN